MLAAAARHDTAVRVAALAGLADGLQHGGRARIALPASQAALLGMLAAEQQDVARAALPAASSMHLAPTAQLEALMRQAAAAFSSAAPEQRREWAVGILGLDASGKYLTLLANLLTPSQPEAVQLAAARALSGLESRDATPVLLERWRASTGKVRDVLLRAFFSDRKRLPVLLEAIQNGTVQPWTLGPARTRQLLQHEDPATKKQAQAILSEPESNRKPVYEKYLPAITRPGRPERGRQIFARACSECHKVDGVGHELGPDLRSVSKRYKETLLADILMPNQNIEGGYEEYLLETADGREVTGILAKETPTTLTLRRRKGDEDTILRSSVKSLRSLSVSPMPEDLEKSIGVDEMADLIAFIKSLK